LNELSGEQQQHVAIVRAPANEPAILRQQARAMARRLFDELYRPCSQERWRLF
jgi:ABC-type polar amino acid transport system ATPase subunit